MVTGGSGASIALTVGAASGITSGTTKLTVNPGTAATITASGPSTQKGTITFSNNDAGDGSSLSLGNMTYNFTNSSSIGTPADGVCTVHVSSGNPSTNETNLLGAMNASSGGSGVGNGTWRCGSRAGQEFSVTGSTNSNSPPNHTITVTANVQGSTGYGTPDPGSTGLNYSESTAASDGTSSGTLFNYWNGSVADTAEQLAASLASSINASSAGGSVTATSNANATGNLVITADTTGTGGDAYTVAVTSFSAVTVPGTGHLTGGSASGSTPGVYPAKYASGSASAAHCGSDSPPDYVVYPTGVAGSSTSATIVAYDNIYAGCSGTVPTVYWAYNTGTGSVVTSPILSYDGTQVAFIETPASGFSTLRILKFVAGQGADVSTPVAPTSTHTNTTAGAGGNTAWGSCPGGSSCMISVAFQTGAANLDTNSSPFYDFDNDIVYVGDDSGKLHKFTGVFKGTPGEVTTNWPVTLSGKLTSPVIDPSTGSVFVGSGNGRLYQVTTPNGTPATVTSNRLRPVWALWTRRLWIPRRRRPTLYGFSLATTMLAARRSAIDQILEQLCGQHLRDKSRVHGRKNRAAPRCIVYDGDFDNTHYSGNGTTGNLYFCGGKRLPAMTHLSHAVYRFPCNLYSAGPPRSPIDLTSGRGELLAGDRVL